MSLLGAGNVTIAELAEFERRLRELSAELQAKALANSELEPGDTIVTSGVPKLSGFTVTSTTSKIVLGWNRAPIADLKRYEVQVSTSDGFGDSDTFFTRETSWTYTAGTSGVTYFFRVRARNFIEEVGPWTTTTTSTSSTPKLTETVDIAPAAVSVQAAAFTAASVALTNGAWVEVQTVTLTTLTTDDVVIQGVITFVGGTAVGTFRMLRDGVVVFNPVQSMFGTQTTSLLFADTTPIAGETVYSVECNPNQAGKTCVDRGIYCSAFKR